jgi:alpha-glucosidase (family GH31 glycosyl hydrolase)
MVTPCLIKGNKKTETTQIKIYAPKNSKWFRISNGDVKTEGYSDLTVKFNEVAPVFIREGFIVH